MPEGWRAKAASTLAHSGPVSPWSGLHCSYKGPYRDDWTIVDRLVETQLAQRANRGLPRDRQQPVDRSWINDYAAIHGPPKINGSTDWASLVRHFSGRWKRPAMTYFEEMMASVIRPEWRTFQDEWGIEHYYPDRRWPTEQEWAANRGIRVTEPVSFSSSYRDYALWYMNEWMKRGISIYWDNTYPKMCFDPRVSDAYLAEDGDLQPALTFFAQRAYAMRTWRLFEYWRRHQPEPLEWSMHMTNSLLLPLHTWPTTLLDYELWSERPYPPEMLLVQSTGRQVGAYSHAINALTGSGNPLLEKPKEHDRGMRIVHEIAGTGRNEHLAAFGYGDPEVRVFNYWDDRPAVAVDREDVRWLLLARPRDRAVLLVLQGWNEEAAAVRAVLDPEAIGFTPAGEAVDLLTGDAVPVTDGTALRTDLAGPYGMAMVRIAPVEASAGEEKP